MILYLGNYGLQGFIHALPHHAEYFAGTNYSETVFDGFVQSTIGLIALTFGFVVGAPILEQINRRITQNTKKSSQKLVPITIRKQVDPMRLALIYIVTGLVSYFILDPTLGSIPTLNTFMQGLYRLFPAGLILGLLFTETSLQRSTYIRPLFITLLLIWPFVDIIRGGFLGFGLFIIIAVLGFLLMRVTNFVRLGIVGVVIGYIILSVMVTYFINRGEIRGAVWGGAEFDARIEVVGSSFLEDFQWFDLENILHLQVIDVRLNLNYFTGLAVQRLNAGLIDYEHGQTIFESFVAVIPRAIWADKPIIAGGSTLVANYTGLNFSSATTFAIGYVMDLYVNYSVFGVIGGFLIIGVLLRLLGSGIETALNQQQYIRFAPLAVVGFGICSVGNDLDFLVGTSVSAFISISFYNYLLLHYAPPTILFSEPLEVEVKM